MRNLLQLKKIKEDKKGIFGMDEATNFVIGILSLILIAVIVLVVVANVNTPSVQDATNNDSTRIISNFSQGLTQFFSGVGLWLTLLGVVIIVLIVVVVIAVLKRTQSGGSASV